MSIRLDVLRHGLALPSSPTGDPDRVLSEQGILEIRRLAAALVREHWRPTLALTSPYLRARQTAALMLEALPEVMLESLEALAPDALTGDLVTELGTWVEPDEHLLLVTHQPLAGELVNRLTNQSVSLAPGTLIELRCELPLAASAGRVVGVRRAPAAE
jgi:phosphohistidine phosphatase